MVKQGEPERQFYFGAMVYGDYLELAFLLADLEDRLNEQIDLSTYTDKLERIYFAPLLVPELDEDREEECWYDAENKELLLMLQIVADQYRDAPESTFAALIGARLSEEIANWGFGDKTLSVDIQQALTSGTQGINKQ